MKKIRLLFLILPLAALFQIIAFPSPAGATVNREFKFYSVKEQSPQFIHHYKTISLTKEEEAIKVDALSKLQAPCCNDNSALTCCCPCNLAKTTWGLTNLLIREYKYTAPQIRKAVTEWVKFTNKDGYKGDACYTGRCGLPFEQDGCGGMGEKLILGS